jgi:Helix-turn-helix family
VERLREQGWLAADATLNEDGRRRRQSIEDRTDELSIFPYEAIGEDGCARLRELARPLSRRSSTPTSTTRPPSPPATPNPTERRSG